MDLLSERLEKLEDDIIVVKDDAKEAKKAWLSATNLEKVWQRFEKKMEALLDGVLMLMGPGAHTPLLALYY